MIKVFLAFGKFRWSLIASHLPGRTDNEIKNYWNSHLSRKVYSFRGSSTTTNYNNTKEIPLQQGIVVDTPPKRKCGRTSRWAMKKNKRYTQNVFESPKLKRSEPSMVTFPPTPALESEKLGLENGPCSSSEDRNGPIGLHLPCFVGKNIETDRDRTLGPYPNVINDSDVLDFNDIMDTCKVEEKRENNDDMLVINERVGNTTKDQESNNNYNAMNNGFNGELNSSDDNWDWESVMPLLNQKEQSVSWEEQNENTLTWLWDDDELEKDFQRFREIDLHKQNAMVSWFLS